MMKFTCAYPVYKYTVYKYNKLRVPDIFKNCLHYFQMHILILMNYYEQSISLIKLLHTCIRWSFSV